MRMLRFLFVFLIALWALGVAYAAVRWATGASQAQAPTPTPVRAQEELLDVAVAPYDPVHARQCVDRGDVLVVPLAEGVLDAPARLACARPADLEWIRPLRKETVP